MIIRIFNKIKNRLWHYQKHWLLKWYKVHLAKQPFCIISNDCFSGELYRYANQPYNTPFVGLMLMAPCYIQLLENLSFYLGQPLVFIEASKYAERNEARLAHPYPLALLHDVEIHFMHFKTAAQASETWERRKQRLLNENEPAVIFSVAKDYANEHLMQRFNQLPFLRKLMLGPGLSELPCYCQVKNMSKDASIAHRQAAGEVNISGWIKNNNFRFTNSFQRWRAGLFFKALNG